MGGIFSGIGQQAFEGFANQGVNNMFGGGLAGQLASDVVTTANDQIFNRLPEFGMPQQPGYQQPPMGQMPQQPLPQQPLPQQQQYFQQMRQNLDGLSQAFKQIEEMQMPGGQYQGDFGGSIMGRAGK
jgi:hypothetical protein